MTIVPRGERFGVKVWVPATRKRKWLGTFDTLEEASQAEKDAQIRPGRDSLPVDQWSRIWLSDYSRPAASTRMLYRQAVKTIVAALGGLHLDEVTRPQARNLAQGWPRNTSAIARTMWSDAVRDGVCLQNPFSQMRLPQSRGRRDIVALTEAQIGVLADLAESCHGDYGITARALVLVHAYVAIRPGELCALRWSDVDLYGRETHIRFSRDVTGAEKAPKNGKARLVTIPPLAVEAVSALHRSLTDDYVFHSITGKPLTKPNLWYVWRPVAKAWEAAGNPHLTLYELRHASATLLLERGLSASDVAVQLGHTDGGLLVSRLYGHPDQKHARDRLKMAFAGDERSHSGADVLRRASK